MKLPIPLEQLKSRLLAENLVTENTFDEYATEAERKNQDIVDVLISKGTVDALYLYNIFAEALGVEMAKFSSRQLDPATVTMLSEDIAREKETIVFGREEDGTLDVAMGNPSDLLALEFLSQHFNAKIKPFLATPDDLKRGFAIYGSEQTGDFRAIIEKNIQESLRRGGKEGAETELPIVEAVDNLLSYAASLRASDIHFEILEEALLIRYRVDGILFEIMRVSKAVHPAIVARIKLLSGLKLDEHYAPQDGRFRYKAGNQIIDVRVAVMPTYYGEKVVMRLLEAAQKPLSLEEIGMLSDVSREVMENLKKTFGMIIICGPTGSGKTTTLYALMNILNRPEVNICTIEDPIEYNMRYANQSQVNPQAGITFATGLKSLLRQDPNIIMVGEIRDGETANIGVQAALTGHLILTSLHTNDAPTSIPRLFDLGVPPFLATSTLNLIVAQRLVRRICPTCIYSYEPEPALGAAIQEQFDRMGMQIGYKLPKVIYRGKGCNACGGTGYRGRIGIFEVLEVRDNIRKVIINPHFNLEELKMEARKNGMRTMFEDGLSKIELALTTIDEVLRVIQE